MALRVPSDVAKSFVAEPIYQFSEFERGLLKPFFTNPDRRVFFMHTFPAAVGDVLLAMYSRMKNPRGLRGTFLDQFLPGFLAVGLRETMEQFDGDGAKFLKSRGITSLEKFLIYSNETRNALAEFQLAFSLDPDYIQKFAAAAKVKKFLQMYLDAYGHNSIARMATVWIGLEQISILAAKSIEWGRPGAGYIELSTRYVDMSGKGTYPIAEELAAYGVNRDRVNKLVETSFDYYRHFQGEDFNGPFPNFLREKYGELYTDAPADLKTGVIGETCDVLGNFLPACTLTSVGCAISGEALPELVRHLRLDNTSENFALADEIEREGEKLGLGQFLRHTEISPWKEASWQYLTTEAREWIIAIQRGRGVIEINLPSRDYVERALLNSFQFQKRFGNCETWQDVLNILAQVPRNEHDKIPNHFEGISASFGGEMSFRGWRDLHRMSFCTHYRTLLNPWIGFYRYDKPAVPEFPNACRDLHYENKEFYREMVDCEVPEEMRQYPLALGNLVGFIVSANLSQFEFCGWQRTDWSVNHEVRQVFLGIESLLRRAYPWWQELSEIAKNAEGEKDPRADMTPAYIFARGKRPIPLA